MAAARSWPGVSAGAASRTSRAPASAVVTPVIQQMELARMAFMRVVVSALLLVGFTGRLYRESSGMSVT
jgi:hypothetical protein